MTCPVYTHHGDSVVCEVEGEHEVRSFPDAQTMHYGTWTDTNGDPVSIGWSVPE